MERSTKRSDVTDAITAHRDQLQRPGVLSVRPGWELKDGWLTGKRAAVATVRHKVKKPPDGQMLPDQIGGLPVDVRQASPAKRQELTHPESYAKQLRLAPDLGSVPHFEDEVAPDGSPVGQGASAHAALARVTKTQLDYSPPAGGDLSPVSGSATIHLSASPDSGWQSLSTFLTAVASHLTVGLYDFTSAHVLQAVTAAAAGKTLKLTLDHPAQNPTADQTDADSVAALQTATSSVAGSQFQQAWALSKLDPEATAWIFATAYHIKVAVADSQRFWLSSGNWNNSNQPDIDPVEAGPGSDDAVTATHSDRDWHVIVDHPVLSATFEAYLLNDLQTAATHNSPPQAASPPLAPPTPGKTVTPSFVEFFGPTSITGEMTLTPLLTPDPGIYVDAIKALIEGAQSSLCMQFQYIEPPKTTDALSQPFVDLINAVIARQQAGVSVRIIASEYQTAGYLEQLQDLGLDVVNNVRLQNNVHNKGVIVDGQRVLVSSQNWSTDGTLYNRDAGLIIEHPDAAAYFQQIFDHDWDNLAHQKANED
jgi:hypothetical protein